MNISIPQSLREFVEAQVERCGYNSASEYVCELICDARDRMTKEGELRDLVQQGLRRLRRDESLEFDEASLGDFFRDVKARARQGVSRKKPGRR